MSSVWKVTSLIASPQDNQDMWRTVRNDDKFSMFTVNLGCRKASACIENKHNLQPCQSVPSDGASFETDTGTFSQEGRQCLNFISRVEKKICNIQAQVFIFSPKGLGAWTHMQKFWHKMFLLQQAWWQNAKSDFTWQLKEGDLKCIGRIIFYSFTKQEEVVWLDFLHLLGPLIKAASWTACIVIKLRCISRYQGIY